MTAQAVSRASRLASALALALLASACAATSPTRGVEPLGFLRDYDSLVASDEDGALVFIGAGVDWRAYDAIMIDSVAVWHETGREKIPDPESQRISDFLYAALQRELSKDYAIVDHPGPGVMRLRAAVSEVMGARFVGNTLTTAVPQHRLLSPLHDRGLIFQTWLAAAAIEVELLDSMTSGLLAAVVDARASGRALGGRGGRWKDVDDAFTGSARRLRERLEEQRGS